MVTGNILIADDDAAIRTVLNQALARAGYSPKATAKTRRRRSPGPAAHWRSHISANALDKALGSRLEPAIQDGHVVRSSRAGLVGRS